MTPSAGRVGVESLYMNHDRVPVHHYELTLVWSQTLTEEMLSSTDTVTEIVRILAVFDVYWVFLLHNFFFAHGASIILIKARLQVKNTNSYITS